MVALSDLNEAQRRAVTAPVDRPTLVVAGAGSGKTTTLIRRIEWLVSEGVPPERIAAATFTRKAAGEMADRLARAGVDGVWTGTLHSFAYARYRAFRAAAGLDPVEVIRDAKVHVRRLRGRPNGDYLEALPGFPERIDMAVCLTAIDHWQNELVDPDQANAEAEDEVEAWCARLYEAYTRWKDRTSRLDFGDMIFRLVSAYVDHPEFLAGDRGLFLWPLVDELQDTNAAQWRLIELLWAEAPLFGVGDPRQAIYEWRGARPGELVAFTDRWPDAVVCHLTVNYRSIPQILRPAQAMIAGTVEAKVSEPLVAHRGPGPEPVVGYPDDLADEASQIAGEISRLLDDGIRPGEIAVLYRTNAQSADLENELAAAGIPYQLIGSKGFWGHRVVRHLTAYLALAEDPDDVDALRMAIAAPSRYLGKAFIEAAVELARENGWTMVEAVGHVVSYSGRRLHPRQADAAADFTTLIRRLARLGPADALRTVLTSTDYRNWLARDDGSVDEEGGAMDEIVDQLVAHAARFPTTRELLAHVSKQLSKASTGSKPDPNRVQLSTIHRAKGLEWSAVFVVGVSDGLLPHERSLVAEERRLAYVAFTRARDRLWISAPKWGWKGPMAPSPFLTDAGLRSEEVVEVGGGH